MKGFPLEAVLFVVLWLGCWRVIKHTPPDVEFSDATKIYCSAALS